MLDTCQKIEIRDDVEKVTMKLIEVESQIEKLYQKLSYDFEYILNEKGMERSLGTMFYDVNRNLKDLKEYQNNLNSKLCTSEAYQYYNEHLFKEK